MLFLPLTSPDRTKTQTAYAAQYMPWRELTQSAEALIVWRKFAHFHKAQIMACLNPDMTELYFNNDMHRPFKIVWVFNSIPTQLEWEKKSDSFIMSADFRVVNGIGPIVQLSFF